MSDQSTAVAFAAIVASDATESDDTGATAPSPKTYLTGPDNHPDAGFDVEF